jgi:NDP-sugar pyrophosphorylase family protein
MLPDDPVIFFLVVQIKNVEMKPTLLILAAGIGSRYGGLKKLDPLGPSGETIIDYSVYDAIRAGFGKVVFVIRENIEQEFRKAYIDRLKDKIDMDYVFQEIRKVPEGVSYAQDRQKPWGTGHAVLMAAGMINTPFAVINADDFYGQSSFRAIADHYKNWSGDRANDYCMVGYDIENTLSEHGAVSRGVCMADENSFLLEVTERTKIERTSVGIAYKDENDLPVIIPEKTIVSMNFWGFTPSYFHHLEISFREFINKNAANLKAEFYIPSVVNELVRSGKATVKVLDCREKWFGMTYREDREMVVAKIQELVDQHIYPGNLWE